MGIILQWIPKLFLLFTGLINSSKGSEPAGNQNGTNSSGTAGKALFRTRPYDYEVDYPSTVLHGRFCFNSHLIDFLMPFEHSIAKCYYELFVFVYPGLQNVSIHPNDIESLILFAMLYLSGDDPKFFPEQFATHVNGISKTLEKLYISDAYISKDFIKCIDRWKDSSEAAKRFLFSQAVQHNCCYTAEAFFAAGIEAFNSETLIFAIHAASISGDSRLTRRIASEIDLSLRRDVIAEAASNHNWPVYLGELSMCTWSGDPYMIAAPDINSFVHFMAGEFLGKVPCLGRMRILTHFCRESMASAGRFYPKELEKNMH